MWLGFRVAARINKGFKKRFSVGWQTIAMGVAIIAFLAIVIAIHKTIKRRHKEKVSPPSYLVGRPLLSETEKKLFNILEKIAPNDVLIFPKVRVADVLQPRAETGSDEWRLARRRISIKHFDFIVCDKSSYEVRFIIELDRAIHETKKPDSYAGFLHTICGTADLDLKRVRVSQSYDPDTLKRDLFGAATDKVIFQDPVTLYEKIRLPEWRSYELEMSQQGFAKAANLVARREKQKPQVYVHVGLEGNLKGQVIRIGCAKNGVFRRWFRSNNGHMNAFFWATGVSSKFSKDFAKRYANYLLFLASLNGQKTALKIISCESRESMLMKERALTAEYQPIWDQFARSTDPHQGSATRGGLNKPSIIKAISSFGMADKLLTVQRKQRFESWQGLPDIFAAQLKSGKLWQ